MVRVFMREAAEAIWGDQPTSSPAGTYYHIDGVLRSLETPDPSIEIDPKYYQNTFKPGNLIAMRKTLEGRFDYFPYSGKLFYYALGKKQTGSYDTLSIQDLSVEFPKMTWKVQYYHPVEFIRQFKGVYIGRMKWSVEQGAYFVAEADLKSILKPTKVSKSDPSGTRRNIVPAFSSTVNFAGLTTEIMRAEVELNNNPEVKFYIEDADGYPTAILQKKKEITGRVSFNPKSSDIWDKLVAQDDVNLTITVKRSDTDKCVIEATNGKIKTVPQGIPEEGLVETDVDIIFKDLTIKLYGNFK